MRRGDGVDAGVAVEDRVILVGEIVERRRDRERDHDGVDALGAHRERAGDRAEDRGERSAIGVASHHGQPRLTVGPLTPKIAIM